MPRAVFLVTEEAGTDRRLFLPLKNNLAPDRVGYAFRIENRIVAHGIGTSAVVWDHDPVTITADEALAAAAKNSKRRPRLSIFWSSVLSDGPMDQTEIVRLGERSRIHGEEPAHGAREIGRQIDQGGLWSGRQVGVGAAGRRNVLKLVVDNDANKPTPPDNKQRAGSTSGDDDNQTADHAPDAGTATEPGKPEGGPDRPDGGNAA